MINISLGILLTTVSIGGGEALVDAINLHYLVKKNKIVHPMRSSSSRTTKSWLGTDLRNLNGSLHHFDFTNLDPTVADININLGSYDYGDIYHEIGQKLDDLFLEWNMNISFSDHMSLDKLDEEFLILNHDCFFSNSKEDPMTGEHWKMTDQRWQAPTKQDIPEDYYYCYNLQLVNLYNHTSLTFACNVCNFVNKKYGPYNFHNYGDYVWDNGHILPNNAVYFRIHNLNNSYITYKDSRRVFEYFIDSSAISFDYSFRYENSKSGYHNPFDDSIALHHTFYLNNDEIIHSPADVHFSSDDRLWEDGSSGYFDRNKVHHLVDSDRWTSDRGSWKACFEWALFTHAYWTEWGGYAWIIAGGAWKNVDRFPGEHSDIYWQINFYINNVYIGTQYDKSTFNNHHYLGHGGLTDYSHFLKIDSKPDYILTSENELYWFYRSSVSFNFFNTDLIDQVIVKKANEGLSQNLVLNHDYTLTKKAGCYQFLVTFPDFYHSMDYYGYKGYNSAKTITFNIRIIPDYDFSQGLNAVTLNYISNGDGNYTYPAQLDNAYWVVDIYLDRKTVRQFYHWLKRSFLVTTQMLSFFNLNFKNFCSFDDLNGKDSIDHFQDNQLYKYLDDQMTHNNDRLYLEALQNAIDFFCIKNNKSGHLHFVLKKDEHWKILNSGKFNTNHFYDKIVQPDQWK